MLTRHASTKVGGTVSVLSARVVVAALDQRGVDVDPVLSCIGVTRVDLESIEHRIPFESVSELWEAAAAAAKEPALGVHVAESLPHGAYDVMDYILSAAKTVGEGLARYTHYGRVIYDRTNLHLTVDSGVARVARSFPVPCPGQFDEFTLAYLLTRSRMSCGVDWTPRSMSFQHSQPSDLGELSRIFRCPLAFGAYETELAFDAPVLDLPHKQSDSRLLEILSRYADSLLPAVPGDDPFLANASSTIAHRMAVAVPTLASTAKSIRYPERSLQRRLAKEGVTHSKLVDNVRRDLAMKYIGDPKLSIGEIAYLLHFGDTTAFHRAFRRWTGQAPAKFRRRLSLKSAA